MAFGTWYFAVSSDAYITYPLMVGLVHPAEVRVGALGRFRFPAGHYVYTGSALRGIESGIQRHLSARKKRHWHIDYLLAIRQRGSPG